MRSLWASSINERPFARPASGSGSNLKQWYLTCSQFEAVCNHNAPTTLAGLSCQSWNPCLAWWASPCALCICSSWTFRPLSACWMNSTCPGWWETVWKCLDSRVSLPSRNTTLSFLELMHRAMGELFLYSDIGKETYHIHNCSCLSHSSHQSMVSGSSIAAQRGLCSCFPCPY